MARARVPRPGALQESTFSFSEGADSRALEVSLQCIIGFRSSSNNSCQARMVATSRIGCMYLAAFMLAGLLGVCDANRLRARTHKGLAAHRRMASLHGHHGKHHGGERGPRPNWETSEGRHHPNLRAQANQLDAELGVERVSLVQLMQRESSELKHTNLSAGGHHHHQGPAFNASAVILECGASPMSHICDPEHALSVGAKNIQNEVLGRLAATTKLSECPEKGFQVYVALLDVASAGAQYAATELGRRWGTLGGKCAGGVVAVFSLRDHSITMAADREPQMLLHASPMHTNGSTADGIVSSLVSQVVITLDPKVLGQSAVVVPAGGITLVLCVITGVVGLAFSLLMLCCMCDAVVHHFHRQHFRSCERKLKLVHDTFLNRKGDMPLCPYCIETISSQASSNSKVVFLCGHRFHMGCANKWFRDYPQMAGNCPICTGSDSSQQSLLFAMPTSCHTCSPCKPQMQIEHKEPEEDQDSEVSTSVDEAQSFILKSLQRVYPDIISEACVQRWARCHTEIWISELTCPKYISLLKKPKFTSTL